MNKKIIIIVVSVILMIAVVGIAIYYLVNKNFDFAKTITDKITNSTENPEIGPAPKIVVLTQEEIEAQNKKNYPEIITGAINFLDKGSTIKTTVKTIDGKEYTLLPNQPKVIYESFGVKNGSKIQIQGRFTEDNKIEWVTMKAI